AETADGEPAVLIGTPWVHDGKLYNACALLDEGRVAALTFKVDLPNYGVFDEKRVFAPGPAPGPFNVRGVRIGVPVCEDIWTSEVVECLSETGGEILLVPNGSPFEAGKEDVRLNLVVARVHESGLPLVYLNQVGGQDEGVVHGAPLGGNADGKLAHALPAWEEALVMTEWTRGPKGWVCAPGAIVKEEDRSTSIYHAMMLGLRDYVNKNRFPGVVLGLSGGIDSALSAAVAVGALGASPVGWVMMPSRYTSQKSLEEAEDAPRRVGAQLAPVPAQPSTDRTASERIWRNPETHLRRPHAQHSRGKHPIAHSRTDPDGGVQQIRPHGADHRQQVRDECGLRDALWRHGRRLQRA